MDFGPEAKDDRAGRAYGRKAGHPDDDLVRCGAGTLGGELLRRYWQPLARSSEAGRLPRLVKILDEELILFRDGSGRPGLLYPRCMHRGTTLLYGKVEEHGIRCCYHGWLFDPEGHVLEMACEPGARPPAGVRQPWYPLVEKYGLIFVYMGPPEKQPAFPRFSVAEDLAEGEVLMARGGIERMPIPDERGIASALVGNLDFNWFQFHDNVLDPFHLYWLHGNLNGVQFVETYRILPEVTFEPTPDGVRSVQYRDLGGGRAHLRMSQSIIPNMHSITPLNDDFGFGGLGWTVPIDDTHFRTFTLGRMRPDADLTRMMRDLGIFRDWGPGKPGDQWTLEDHQTWQSDYVCQKGQGDVSLHSEEHLSATDTGVAMLRRMWRRQAEIASAGGDPVGVTYDEPYLIELRAANALVDSGSRAIIEGPDARGL
jgi:nitrite reductase/ring-hydroxylating ferredoxin subunit